MSAEKKPKSLKLAMIPRITVYQNDGSGRDSYISSNNAGFYKEYRIIKCNNRKSPPKFYHKMFGNLVVDKPVGKYYCDGHGRDVYIFRGNSRNFQTTNGGLNLPDILRNDAILQPQTTLNFNPIGKSRLDVGMHKANQRIGRELIKRIFYGTANLPERRISPKVVFAKKRNQLDSLSQSYVPTDCSKRHAASTFRSETLPNRRKGQHYIITSPDIMTGVKKLAVYNNKRYLNTKAE